MEKKHENDFIVFTVIIINWLIHLVPSPVLIGENKREKILKSKVFFLIE